VSKLFLELDADRLRRTFDDKWFTRVAYPAGLFYPFFVEGSYLQGSDAMFLSFCRGMPALLIVSATVLFPNE
jgi:hypothetical protein